jgi:hypothetical protein
MAISVCSLICVNYRGRFVLAQRSHQILHHHVGYPQGTDDGMRVLRFLWEPGNIERLREGLQYVATLTPEGWEQIHEMQLSLYWDTGASILNMIAQATAENYVPIWLSLDFAISRWCDWTYVVDLDQNTFEVFGGQEHKQKAS